MADLGEELVAVGTLPTQRFGEPAPAGRGSKPKVIRQRSYSILPAEVGTYLAARRPPPNSISVAVGPYVATGQNSHAYVLEAVLREMVEGWPPGTTLIVDYRNGKYLQVLAYAPSILTEMGRLTEAQMASAVKFGWFDPTTFAARHHDFASQPVWEQNPVREWETSVDSLDEMATFLVSSVQRIISCDPSEGYRLRLFNIHADNTADEDSPT
jgi:hypothetical protein